jgi:hypothetical protein
VSHHYSGPDATFPHGDARLDLTDVFAFPGDEEKSVLVMNVHPAVCIKTLQPTTAEPFSPDAFYEFRIDTDGDSLADIGYRFRFTRPENGRQTVTLRRAIGDAARRLDDHGETIIDHASVSLGRDAQVAAARGYRLFAGWRSDPFFFDPLGALDGFRFTGRDFFTDKDICSIVLEVPNTELSSSRIGLWARTVDGSTGRWIQADRGARPSQAVFLPGDQRDAYLAAEPAEDAQFIAAFAHSLEHLGGYLPGEARVAGAALLPDIIRFDPSMPAAYPDNGRKLTDDVMDPFIALLTNGKVTTDGLGPHKDLLSEFPYLGSPHVVRSLR